MKRPSVFDERGSGITGKRRQWAAALAVSFVAHLLVLAGLVAEIDRPPPPLAQPPVTVTLERPIRLPKPPEQKPPEPKPIEKPAPSKPAPAKAAPLPPPAPAPRPVQAAQPVAPAPPPSLLSGTGRAPAASPPAAVAAGRGPALDDEGNVVCIAKNLEKMGPKERLACETKIFSVMDKYDGRVTPPPLSTIDPDKLAAYDAAMARKHYKSAPATGAGNKSQSGCEGANMGMGCPGETAVPVYTKPF